MTSNVDTKEIVNILSHHGYSMLRCMFVIGDNTYYEIKHKDQQQSITCKVTTSSRTYELENKILSSISHKNILRIIESFAEKNFYFQITEHFLDDTLQEKGAIPKDMIRVYALQILGAMEILQSNGIFISNISPKKIFFDRFGLIKLVDFQHAMIIPKRYCTRNAIITEYPAPEICKNKPFNPKCADNWSFGIVLYHMVNGKYPFPSFSNVDEYIKCIANLHYNFTLNSQMLHCPIMSSILAEDPTKRAQLEEIRKCFGQFTVRLPKGTLETNKSNLNIALNRRTKYSPIRMHSYAEIRSHFNSV